MLFKASQKLNKFRSKRKQGVWQSGQLLLCLGCFLALSLLPCAVQAETIYLNGSFAYDKAQNLLNLCNAERSAQGLPTLVYDYGLEALAMQRAAEVAVLLSHNRPDGTTTSYGENFAAGWPSAEAAHQSFMNSTAHRSNILGQSYASMAGGVFFNGSQYFWVEVFGYGYSGPVHADLGSVAVQAVVVQAASQLPAGNYDDKLSLNVGDYIIAQGSSAGVGLLTATWSSSNTAVAQVDAQGKITALSPGFAVVTGNYGQVSKLISVEVVGASVPVSDVVYTPMNIPWQDVPAAVVEAGGEVGSTAVPAGLTTPTAAAELAANQAARSELGQQIPEPNMTLNSEEQESMNTSNAVPAKAATITESGTGVGVAAALTSESSCSNPADGRSCSPLNGLSTASFQVPAKAGLGLEYPPAKKMALAVAIGALLLSGGYFLYALQKQLLLPQGRGRSGARTKTALGGQSGLRQPRQASKRRAFTSCLCGLLGLALPFALTACSWGQGERLVENTFKAPASPPSITTAGPSTAPSETTPPSTVVTTAKPSPTTSRTTVPAKQLFFSKGSGAFDSKVMEAVFKHFLKEQKLEKADLAFAFRDLSTGQSWGYNEELVLEAASTIKVASCMYTYAMAQEGACSLDEVLTVQEEDVEEGSGLITEGGQGAEFSLAQILREAIVNSDNTANRLLYRYWQDKCPEKWLVLAIDARYGLTYNKTKALSPTQALDLMTELYQNPEQVPGYATLRNDMRNSSFQGLVAASLPGRVEQKYGRLGNLLHDIGLCTEPQPFAFAIFTHRVPEAEAIIGQLAELYEQTLLGNIDPAISSALAEQEGKEQAQPRPTESNQTESSAEQDGTQPGQVSVQTTAGKAEP